jgi:glutamine---fructose-6-phosphate transaminase (isomerizing)
MPRSPSTAEFQPLEEDKQVEYFFASDASAVIEHTNRVIFLEVKTLPLYYVQI